MKEETRIKLIIQLDDDHLHKFNYEAIEFEDDAELAETIVADLLTVLRGAEDEFATV